jgi:hypothetical protein
MVSAQEQAQAAAKDAKRKGEQPPGSGTDEEPWDEERIEQALKISKEMHIQVRNCR